MSQKISRLINISSILIAILLIFTFFGCNISKSDNNQPELIGGISIALNDIWRSANLEHLVLLNNYAYVTYMYKIISVDLSDPSAPLKVGEKNIKDFDWVSARLTTDGKDLYLITEKDGIFLVGTQDPKDLKINDKVTTIKNDHKVRFTPSGYNVSSLKYDKNIVEYNGRIIPKVFGEMQIKNAYIEEADNSDNFIYAGVKAYDNSGYRSNMLFVFDVSSPNEPKMVGNVHISSGVMVGDYQGALTMSTSSIFDVLVAGHYAYIAEGLAGIHVIDISKPSEPKFEKTYKTKLDAVELSTDGKYLYAINDNVYRHPYDLMVFSFLPPTTKREMEMGSGREN